MTEPLVDATPAPAAPTAGPGGNRTRWTALAVGAVLVALVAVFAVASGGGDPTATRNALLGQRVPDVSGPTLDGATYDIDNARGRWVVVNFFATWCPGCINEHPELVAFDAWAQETGQAEVVAVVFQDPADAVATFFDENGGGWPVLDEPEVPVAFQVSKIPETFVVSPSGQVVQHIAGEVKADDLIAFIEEQSQP